MSAVDEFQGRILGDFMRDSRGLPRIPSLTETRKPTGKKADLQER